MYTTIMMSTGLTFGSISALFGLTNHIIDQDQYTVLLTAVMAARRFRHSALKFGSSHVSTRWRKMPSWVRLRPSRGPHRDV
jgi:hypothetical protein